jgi:uncharacterized protein YndB with AHSA1/START domain
VIEPLKLELELACPPDHAFAVWTERFDQWWPRSHTVTGDPAAVVLEPHVGGRLYERTADGAEIDWGEITAWEPPRRLAYRWHIRRDRADATDVEIAFTDAGDGTTRLAIVHSGWERLAGGQTWRDANRGGWDGLLPSFVAACTTTSTSGTSGTSDRIDQERTP